MNNIGIIAEYNPFHKGHLYHLNETKKIGQADNVIAIMSGNFTQRGEPAIYDKWTRAEMAVRNGVDLVIELPFIFACNNADFFAYGAVKVLNDLGCITHFSFGSESGELEKLTELAILLAKESNEFKIALKSYLDKGLSFPRARSEAVKSLKGDETADIIRNPNNILAVEYLKQWVNLDSLMKPITIKRSGRGYHDRDYSHPLASATAIRKGIAEKGSMDGIKETLPGLTKEVMESTNKPPITDAEKLFPLLVYQILSTEKSDLASVLSCGEGLENKLKKAITKSTNMTELVSAILSKRYTETRINRLLIHTLINLTKNDFGELIDSPHLYARVLGFNSKGAGLIRHIKKSGCSKIPIISNINRELDHDSLIWRILGYDILSANIYNLANFNNIYERSDYVQSPFRLLPPN